MGSRKGGFSKQNLGSIALCVRGVLLVLGSPLKGRSTSVLAEEAVEILDSLITEHGRDSGDLGRLSDGQDPAGEIEPDVQVELGHCCSIAMSEEALERSHFYAEFSRNGPDSQSYVSMRRTDKMMNNLRRTLEEIPRQRVPCRIP